ncbi:ester cyclase [Streptomyces sp. 1331.2]|uniref:ester cyclase n=1 Tax=Streptomyces sp. 1331.2 TaxID=1938835 RepID=UPI000BD0A7C4|nr:ester cyclase [Streptomyces sp. 1331.2]SOB88819.1 SnoaL-like polyketide cyclase [Streptomyces sp. 1331.2]
MTGTPLTARDVAIRCVQLMGDGSPSEFEALVHPDAVNHESRAEPPAARGRGPQAFHATALWLRAAYSDLRWTIEEAVTEGDLVVLHTTMSGRHTGTFVTYDEHARPSGAFPATGRTFSVTQTHWCRVADGRLIEHWANRDDLGQALQLHWIPPTPGYILRMRLALRRARRDRAARAYRAFRP